MLNDPQAATTKLPHLTVGLAHPDYHRRRQRVRSGGGNGDIVTWAHDGKYYQFWNDGTDDGKFTITNVRPGTYTLHAFADGVLGEFAQDQHHRRGRQDAGPGQARLEARPLRQADLGDRLPRPHRRQILQRRRRQLLALGLGLRYGDLFPNDITYTIGKSDYHKDWFFEQVPHATIRRLDESRRQGSRQPALRLGERSGIPHRPRTCGASIGRGRATTWTIKFNMDKAAARARRPCASRWPAPTATAAWPSPSTARASAPSTPSPPTPSATTPTRASGSEYT